MANRDWDIVILQRAADLLQQAGRIQRNFLQIAVGAQYRVSHGKTPSWQPPVNVVEADGSLWVLVAIPGVASERVDVRLNGRELVISGERPLPACCNDGELKIWEIPLGRFERRLAVLEASNPPTLGKVSLEHGLLMIELRKS